MPHFTVYTSFCLHLLDLLMERYEGIVSTGKEM